MSSNSRRRRISLKFDEGVAAKILAAIPVDSMLIDDKLNVVLVNSNPNTTSFVNEHCVGSRLDRILGCPKSQTPKRPCKNGNGCSTCPVGVSISHVRSKRRKATTCTLHLRRNTAEQLEIQLNLAPISFDSGARYTLVTARDVTRERRHDALESVFSHDLLNTVNRLLGMASVLRDIKTRDGSLEDRFTDGVLETVRDLVAEIRNQRQILKASNGKLQTHPEEIPVEKILAAIQQMFCTWPLSKGRKLVLSRAPSNLILRTNYPLLKQVLENMFKNALEASHEGDQITVDCSIHPPNITFGVHNPSVIPEEVQEKIFTPFFSTKGRCNHGIGTFSMKLLGEQYLGGVVRIFSREEIGTLCLLTIPIRLKDSPATSLS